jgi:hypothetical protein
MTLQPLTIKKFSTDRKTFNTFDFGSHLEDTGLRKKFTVKDKKHGGGECTYKVYIEGKRMRYGCTAPPPSPAAWNSTPATSPPS